VPVQVAGVRNAIAITAGAFHSVAVVARRGLSRAEQK